jgi:hypothetical protein
MAAASRAAGANHHLSAAERAAVQAYLARLSATVADLAARLDVLQADLHTPACPSGQSSGTPSRRHVVPGLVTAQGAGPWQ